ncbi:hypothetical protein HA402_014156 [Bradysia odoriphaga]|nr:hypothetical protein HA402_014156 [Bradysia odoriphaga]
MPSDAKTCLQSSFIDGLTEKLTANVLRIQKELNGKDCDCNFGNVETALQKISAKIKKIIKILSACDPNEDMLNAAIDRYEELKREYNSAIRRATASQSSKCGSILAKIRPILLNCAENIMAAVLKCLNFRRS